MLKQRIITAVVLLAILLPALFAASPWPFAALTLVMIGAAGWEWARLNGLAGAATLVFGGGLALLGAALLGEFGFALAPPWSWWLAGAIWVFGGALALRAGVTGWPRIAAAPRLGLGAVALVVAWLAIVQAKAIGINFLLSIFCLVWCADVAAYFGGKAFGRSKLAPTISPGKSWAGVWSGLIAVCVLGAVWVHAIDANLAVDSASLYTQLVHRWGAGSLVAIAFLVAMSVVGDLFESLIKRAVGAKDSSQLLPGHGGVLDRVDALLPVFPLALALISL
ncbi:MAG: phosphatidate cytidylyltransferase [Pelomonas sp.]|nr:phosphatidate cytidylyltransferase [Roseateles sp.]